MTRSDDQPDDRPDCGPDYAPLPLYLLDTVSSRLNETAGTVNLVGLPVLPASTDDPCQVSRLGAVATTP